MPYDPTLVVDSFPLALRNMNCERREGIKPVEVKPSRCVIWVAAGPVVHVGLGVMVDSGWIGATGELAGPILDVGLHVVVVRCGVRAASDLKPLDSCLRCLEVCLTSCQT